MCVFQLLFLGFLSGRMARLYHGRHFSLWRRLRRVAFPDSPMPCSGFGSMLCSSGSRISRTHTRSQKTPSIIPTVPFRRAAFLSKPHALYAGQSSPYVFSCRRLMVRGRHSPVCSDRCTCWLTMKAVERVAIGWSATCRTRLDIPSRRPVQCSLPVRPCLGSADRASTSLPLECLTPRTPTGQRESEVDSTGCIAVALSAGIILTTIHTQDYKDVLGDAAAGRVTLPIAHPVASRVVTAFILVAWSWGVSLTWQLDGITAAVMGVLALVVGVSFVARRDAHADVVSSYLYNVSQQPNPHGPSPVLTLSHMRLLPGVAFCRIFTPWILQVALGIMTSCS